MTYTFWLTTNGYLNPFEPVPANPDEGNKLQANCHARELQLARCTIHSAPLACRFTQTAFHSLRFWCASARGRKRAHMLVHIVRARMAIPWRRQKTSPRFRGAVEAIGEATSHQSA